MRKQCPIYSNFSLKEKQKAAKDPIREAPKSPKMVKTLASPRQIRDHTKFSPLASMMKHTTFSSSFRDLKAAKKPLQGAKKTDHASAFRNAEEDKAKHGGSKGVEDCDVAEDSESVSVAHAVKGTKRTPWLEPEASKDMPMSPSMNTEAVRELRRPKEPMEVSKFGKADNSVLFCSCGEPCENDGSTQCPKCKKAGQPTNECFGFLYEKSEGEKNMLNRYWFSLVGKELYSIFYYIKIIKRICSKGGCAAQ